MNIQPFKKSKDGRIRRVKIDSRRRWKARCWLGRPIPKEAIKTFGLGRWFFFEPVDDVSEYYIMTGTTR